MEQHIIQALNQYLTKSVFYRTLYVSLFFVTRFIAISWALFTFIDGSSLTYKLLGPCDRT